jgi:putative membrane protein
MIRKRIFSLLIILSTLTFSACAQGPNSPMGNWGGHMMGGGYGGGFMWLLILVLVGGVVFFLFQTSKSKSSIESITETPSDILKKRYANGEINKDEFDRIKNDLES